MSDYQAPYRGTPTTMRREMKRSAEWMVNICMRLIEDFDDAPRELCEEMLLTVLEQEPKSEAMSSDRINVPGFHQSFDRNSGQGYTWNHSGRERTDWFMVWKIGKNMSTRWGGQKITMRKDGSVHEDNLKGALLAWANSEISSRRRASIKEANLVEYETYQSPGKHDNFVTVELSEGKLGVCNITYSNTWVKLGKVLDVPIRNAENMIRKMQAAAENFAADAVIIRDDP